MPLKAKRGKDRKRIDLRFPFGRSRNHQRLLAEVEKEASCIGWFIFCYSSLSLSAFGLLPFLEIPKAGRDAMSVIDLAISMTCIASKNKARLSDPQCS